MSGTVTTPVFAGQNWLILPVPVGVGQSSPAPADQDFLLVLSGVVIVNMQGDNPDDWRRTTITIFPDVNTPLTDAIAKYGLPGPTNTNPDVAINLSQWVPFAAVSSGFEKQSGGVDAGYAVDDWRPTPFLSRTDSNGGTATQIFQGINVDLAVRNTDAFLYRVSYNITLVGKIITTRIFLG